VGDLRTTRNVAFHSGPAPRRQLCRRAARRSRAPSGRAMSSRPRCGEGVRVVRTDRHRARWAWGSGARRGMLCLVWLSSAFPCICGAGSVGPPKDSGEHHARKAEWLLHSRGPLVEAADANAARAASLSMVHGPWWLEARLISGAGSWSGPRAQTGKRRHPRAFFSHERTASSRLFRRVGRCPLSSFTAWPSAFAPCALSLPLRPPS
jgi:hypothetical protein